ncbi:MAG TPA: sigma 54-interacting transcriptional regulator [Candidatus Binatia bacterium]|nr:sigma 54-interacting transcriptional regulator [Candidatus Binatia bacterium]
MSNSEIAKDSLKTLDTAFEEIAIAQQQLLEEAKQIALTQEAAEEEKVRYRDIFELAPDAYFVTDRDGIIREANAAGAAILRVPKQSLLGQPLTAFVDGEAAKELFAQIGTCPPGDPQRFELRLRRVDGRLIAVTVAVTSDAKRGALLWLFRDVSRQEKIVEGGSYPELFIGTSAAMLAVKKQIDAVTPFPMVTVLLEGETGTGKDLIAQVIHNATFGSKAPFVPINCPAIPDHLLESELFGYEKGAFTDASSKKPGLFELAHGGTLFLDEVSSLSASLQPKLLRVLETKTFTRLGGLRKIKINCRITGATNKPLRELVEQGKFREDLYHRLSTFTINIPPLRERCEDISLMAHAFIEQTATALRTSVRGITPDAVAALEAYHWPGNVRELKKIIERAVILTPPTEYIETTVFPKEVLMGNAGPPIPVVGLRGLEKQHLAKILAACGGNKSQAAKLLGISRTTLRKKLEA